MKRISNSVRFILALLLGVIGSGFAEAKAQTIQQVRVSYELAVPLASPNANPGESKVHVFFGLEGIESVNIVEVLAGTGPGKEDAKHLNFRIVKRQGTYYLNGSSGEFLIENNVVHLSFPLTDTDASKAKYISVTVINGAGAKSPYSWAMLN